MGSSVAMVACLILGASVICCAATALASNRRADERYMTEMMGCHFDSSGDGAALYVIVESAIVEIFSSIVWQYCKFIAVSVRKTRSLLPSA